MPNPSEEHLTPTVFLVVLNPEREILTTMKKHELRLLHPVSLRGIVMNALCIISREAH